MVGGDGRVGRAVGGFGDGAVGGDGPEGGAAAVAGGDGGFEAVAVPGAMVSFTYSVAVPRLLVAVILTFQVPARVEDPARMPLVKVTPSGRIVLSVSSFSML